MLYGYGIGDTGIHGAGLFSRSTRHDTTSAGVLADLGCDFGNGFGKLERIGVLYILRIDS